MDYTRLGRTGLKVSRLCLGTMTFGNQCDEPTSRAILDAAAEGGITFLDTADVYPLGGTTATVGGTEEILGRWLAGRRQDFVLATKCHFPMSERPWDRGNSRKHVLDAIDASLRRLRTDHVDLYQLHFWDPETPLDETLRALEDVVRSGRARYVGCSNFLAWQLARALGRSEALGVVRLDSVQPRYNLLFREFERELFPLCQADGVGVIPYNPIAGGLLSGKHRLEGGPAAGTRFTLGTAATMYQERYWNERMFAAVERLQARGGRGRARPGDDGGRLGDGQPRRHRAHRRRQPAGAAAGLAGGGRDAARPGPQGPARRADPGVSLGRRDPLGWRARCRPDRLELPARGERNLPQGGGGLLPPGDEGVRPGREGPVPGRRRPEPGLAGGGGAGRTAAGRGGRGGRGALSVHRLGHVRLLRSVAHLLLRCDHLARAAASLTKSSFTWA